MCEGLSWINITLGVVVYLRWGALHQVIHVPLDRVQVLLDFVEVLHRLVGPKARCVSLVLDRAHLLQRLLEGNPAAEPETRINYG